MFLSEDKSVRFHESSAISNIPFYSLLNLVIISDKALSGGYCNNVVNTSMSDENAQTQDYNKTKQCRLSCDGWFRRIHVQESSVYKYICFIEVQAMIYNTQYKTHSSNAGKGQPISTQSPEGIGKNRQGNPSKVHTQVIQTKHERLSYSANIANYIDA